MIDQENDDHMASQRSSIAQLKVKMDGIVESLKGQDFNEEELEEMMTRFVKPLEENISALEQLYTRNE